MSDNVSVQIFVTLSYFATVHVSYCKGSIFSVCCSSYGNNQRVNKERLPVFEDLCESLGGSYSKNNPERLTEGDLDPCWPRAEPPTTLVNEPRYRGPDNPTQPTHTKY